MTTETPALEGRFTVDGVHSTFGFSVVHLGINTFRGSFDDVEATLTTGPDDLSLEGRAKVESISIREPAEFRAHVLSEELFDAEHHPEVTVRSTSVELGDDGAARVEGELTIAGTTREVSAEGTWRGPVKGPDSLARAAIELETSFDRREFGFEWQMELPGGGRPAAAWSRAARVQAPRGAPVLRRRPGPRARARRRRRAASRDRTRRRAADRDP
jgi:polyisoprenoid-binding protein YceI